MVCSKCADRGDPAVEMERVASDEGRKWRCNRCDAVSVVAAGETAPGGIAAVREALQTATPKKDGYGTPADRQEEDTE